MIALSCSLIIWHVWFFGPSGRSVRFENGSDSFPLLLVNEIWDLLFNNRGVIAELKEVFPYFIVGVLLAGYLRTYKVAAKLQASLRKYGVLSIFIASFIGIITPLCACGTLTTAISLLFAGLPLAPVMSLMITSSLLSPSTYLITLNDLGPEWTVIRTIAALFMGIFAGLVAHSLRKRGFETKNLFIEGGITRGDFHDEDYPDERLRCNCRQKFGNRVAVRTGNNFLIFLAKSSEMLWSVGKYIIVGVTMGAIVERYMPTGWVYRFFGQKDPFNIVWVTIISVPMFLHQLSASGILSHIKGALGGTLDGGSALAFMIGGPVTAVPTMVLFWTIFKKRVFALYMFVCLAGTIIIAYGFQLTVFVPGVDTGNELLRGVSALTGGSSLSLTKSGSDVRMVLDPGGTGLLASFVNGLDSRGGVLFDAGFGRFREQKTDQADDRRYILNLARWMAENSSAASNSEILLYDVSAAAGKILSSSAIADLEREGFRVRVMGGEGAPELNAAVLAPYGQLWLFPGSGKGFSEEEQLAVLKFNGEGKSLLLVPGEDGTDPISMSGVNRVSSTFGVLFSDKRELRGHINTRIAQRMLAGSSELLGRFLKLFNKA